MASLGPNLIEEAEASLEETSGVIDLLAVDQQLGEGAALRVAPELADPVGSLEVGKHEDVEQFGAGAGPRVQALRSRSRRSS